jgi:cystathionine beta-lyase
MNIRETAETNVKQNQEAQPIYTSEIELTKSNQRNKGILVKKKMHKYDFDTVHNRKGSGCFKADALQMLFGKDDLLPLWVADMDFAIAPEILEAMQQRLNHPIFGYNLRLSHYYEAILNWVGTRYHWQIKRDWIINTPGIVTAINTAVVTLTKPGDKILIQTPVYDPFFEAVRANHRILVTNPLVLKDGRYEIDWEDFAQKIKQCRMFILCSPHNPVGRVWTEPELLQMGRICRQNNVIVLADEIHADLVYSGHTHVAFASLEDFGSITVACYSPSKSFNLAGLCTSAIIISDSELRKKFNDYIQTMHLFLGNTFGITALQAAYTKGADWLSALVSYLEENRDYLYDSLAKQLPKLHMIKPEGTYLAWVDFRSFQTDDDKLSDRLINQAKLAFNMGKTYGTEGKGFVRINFATPRSQLEEAVNRLSKTFSQDI